MLVPKSKLDQTGRKNDTKFRLKNARTYLFTCVQKARDAIYKSAAAIAGVVVNRLLKATSSVPTLVSRELLNYGCSMTLLLFPRMHLLIGLVLILISHVCLLSISCTSSN